MKRVCLGYFIFFIFHLIIMSCGGQNIQKNVQILVYGEGEVTLSVFNSLSFEDSVVIETIIDSTGTGLLELNLSEPVFAFLKVGENWQRLYLSPGYNLKFYSKNHTSKELSKFEGIGSEVNNYLIEVSSIQEKFERERNIFGLDSLEFIQQIDSLKLVYQNFHNQFNRNFKLNDDIGEILKSKNSFYFLTLEQNYWIDYTNPKVLEFNKNIINNIPLNSTFLNLRLYEYAFLLMRAMEPMFYAPLATDSFPEGYPKDYFLENADKSIKNGNFPPAIKEYFLAKNIDNYMVYDGVTPGIESVLRDFKSRYASSVYLASLNEKYHKLNSISSGQPAPNITGITPDGKDFSLSSLKGKVVYIDVWATWCGPCIKEFPHSKNLVKKFEGNDQVVFLYVSIDHDQGAWQRKVASEIELKGIHILDNHESNHISITETYFIQGIPRYILIDQEGNIVDANASRPSVEATSLQIKALL